MIVVAVLAACLGAIGYGVGSVLEGVAAQRSSGLSVMIGPIYLAGVACDILAWFASIIALQHLTVFTVQAFLSGSLAVTVIAARIIMHTPVPGAKICAMALLFAGMVMVIVSTGPQAAARPPHGFALAMVVGVVVLSAAVTIFYIPKPPMVLSAAAGLAFSGAALAARGLHTSGHVLEALGNPLLWAIVGFGAAGLVAYTRSLESGAVGAVTSVVWVVEIIVPGLIGMWVFGDVARSGWEWAKVIGVALTLAGCVWLAMTDTDNRNVGRTNRERFPAG